MKKIYVLIFLCSAIALACHKNAIPTITTRTKEPPAPTPLVSNVTPDIAMGKTIYTTRCNRCHDLYEPSKYSAQRWDGILSVMIPRARLNPEQKVHVTAYVKENAAK